MKIALTGATGNMGREVLYELLNNKDIDNIRILVLPKDKRYKEIYKRFKNQWDKVEVLIGNLKDKETTDQLVKNVDYVLSVAGVIPPLSDQEPQKAIDCNETGIKNLVKSIEEIGENQPKFVHITTVALYGNRNHLHPWGVVGDPLLVSPLDVYSVTKLRGEFTVLESKIKKWVIIRQTAMLHHKMLTDNLSDGLMFHTVLNCFIEWSTAHDSGLLLGNIVKEDSKQDLGDKFWKRVFNLGGGEDDNRCTGFDTLTGGFNLMNGDPKKFFKPRYSALRNFHCFFYYDGNKLNDMFHYQTETIDEYWKQIGDKHKAYKMGRFVPNGLIAAFTTKPLLKDKNAPAYWYKHNDEAKIYAFFGGKEEYEKLPLKWDGTFNLLTDNQLIDGTPFDFKASKNKETAVLIDHGFDLDKELSDVDIKDLQNVAIMHGGKLLTDNFRTGDVYTKVLWETQDGEKFEATPFTVLYAGHWYNITYKEFAWDFDRLSKKDKIFASLWYDSHKIDEDKFYWLDDEFNSHMKNI